MVNLLVNLLGNPFRCNLDARKFYQSILIIPFRFYLPLASLIDGIELGSQFLTYFSLNANLHYQHLSTSVSMPSGKLETLRNASRREVFKVSSMMPCPVNLYLTRLKSSRGRRKARSAAQMMTACSRATPV